MARIGVNALYLIPGGVGGTEIYLRELLTALARMDAINDYFVFTNLETSADLTPKQANFHWKPQAVHARSRPARILWEQIVLPLEGARYKLDVMFNPGFTGPLLGTFPSVTVFHDLQHKRHPEYFRWFDLPFWKLLLWMSVHRSRRLIAVSQATFTDLALYYGLSEETVAVVHHGVDGRLFDLDRSVTEPVLLCVSTLHPHKNLDLLIRAYARRKRDFKLVIVGMRGFFAEAIDKLVAELGVGDSVTITGWISREELYKLYARAHSFIYPSTFEGFGMPVLEAMAAGIPTACSDIPPLEEVAGGGALLFDPLREDAIDAAMGRIMTDEGLRDRKMRAGRERAKLFSWERTAEETLRVLLAK